MADPTPTAPVITLTKLKCLRCAWEWVPRQQDVRICPHCKSWLWNRAKDAPKKSAGG